MEVALWSIRFQELDCWKSDRRSQECERIHNEKNCNVKWRMTQLKGLFVKTVTNRVVTSLGQCDDRLTAGLCAFRVIDRGKSEAHRRMEDSRAHVQMERHPEFHLVVLTWDEQPKTESRGCADSRKISG